MFSYLLEEYLNKCKQTLLNPLPLNPPNTSKQNQVGTGKQNHVGTGKQSQAGTGK
jgi:hypothetical protein